MADTIRLDFVPFKETKGTVRYAEVPRDPDAPEELVMGTIYVRKEELRRLNGGSFPKRLAVTVSAG